MGGAQHPAVLLTGDAAFGCGAGCVVDVAATRPLVAPGCVLAVAVSASISRRSAPVKVRSQSSRRRPMDPRRRRRRRSHRRPVARAPGVEMRITIEIDADATAFGDATRRTVTENAATLSFDESEFET